MKRILLASLVLLADFASQARAADTVYYYYNDAQGSPVAVTNAHGAVVERTQYAPYGQVLNRPEHDGPGYTKHEEDAATGLTNMQQRYDDKVIGRMLSMDPMDVDTTTGGNFNRYAYANDNPYRYTDPDGRMFGFDDGAAFVLGAIINTAITVARDEATGQPITTGEIAGAAVTGGIEGVGLVNTPETGGLTAAVAYGGLASAAGDAVKQGIDNPSNFSVKEVAESGAVGATIGGITHGIPDARISGLSSGRNSMNAIGKALRTKIANGTAGQMSMKTAMKAAIGSQAANLGRKAVGTSIENNAGHSLTITIKCPASTKVGQPCG